MVRGKGVSPLEEQELYEKEIQEYVKTLPTVKENVDEYLFQKSLLTRPKYKPVHIDHVEFGHKGKSIEAMAVNSVTRLKDTDYLRGPAKIREINDQRVKEWNRNHSDGDGEMGSTRVEVLHDLYMHNNDEDVASVFRGAGASLAPSLESEYLPIGPPMIDKNWKIGDEIPWDPKCATDYDFVRGPAWARAAGRRAGGRPLDPLRDALRPPPGSRAEGRRAFNVLLNKDQALAARLDGHNILDRFEDELRLRGLLRAIAYVLKLEHDRRRAQGPRGSIGIRSHGARHATEVLHQVEKRVRRRLKHEQFVRRREVSESTELDMRWRARLKHRLMEFGNSVYLGARALLIGERFVDDDDSDNVPPTLKERLVSAKETTVFVAKTVRQHGVKASAGMYRDHLKDQYFERVDRGGVPRHLHYQVLAPAGRGARRLRSAVEYARATGATRLLREQAAAAAAAAGRRLPAPPSGRRRRRPAGEVYSLTATTLEKHNGMNISKNPTKKYSEQGTGLVAVVEKGPARKSFRPRTRKQVSIDEAPQILVLDDGQGGEGNGVAPAKQKKRKKKKSNNGQSNIGDNQGETTAQNSGSEGEENKNAAVGPETAALQRFSDMTRQQQASREAIPATPDSPPTGRRRPRHPPVGAPPPTRTGLRTSGSSMARPHTRGGQLLGATGDLPGPPPSRHRLRGLLPGLAGGRRGTPATVPDEVQHQARRPGSGALSQRRPGTPGAAGAAAAGAAGAGRPPSRGGDLLPIDRRPITRRAPGTPKFDPLAYDRDWRDKRPRTARQKLVRRAVSFEERAVERGGRALKRMDSAVSSVLSARAALTATLVAAEQAEKFSAAATKAYQRTHGVRRQVVSGAVAGAVGAARLYGRLEQRLEPPQERALGVEDLIGAAQDANMPVVLACLSQPEAVESVQVDDANADGVTAFLAAFKILLLLDDDYRLYRKLKRAKQTRRLKRKINRFEKMLDFLLSQGADPNALERMSLKVGGADHARGALHHAARAGNLRRLQWLVEELAVDLDPRDEMGITPLMLVSQEGFPKEVCYLISWDADVNAVDKQGRTALHYATHSSSVTIKVLLLCGANTNLRDLHGKTAAEYAKERKKIVSHGTILTYKPAHIPGVKYMDYLERCAEEYHKTSGASTIEDDESSSAH